MCKTREKNQNGQLEAHDSTPLRTGVEATAFQFLIATGFFMSCLRGRLTTCCSLLVGFFVAKILKIYLLEHMNLEEQGVIHMNLGSWK